LAVGMRRIEPDVGIVFLTSFEDPRLLDSRLTNMPEMRLCGEAVLGGHRVSRRGDPWLRRRRVGSPGESHGVPDRDATAACCWVVQRGDRTAARGGSLLGREGDTANGGGTGC